MGRVTALKHEKSDILQCVLVSTLNVCGCVYSAVSIGGTD